MSSQPLRVSLFLALFFGFGFGASPSVQAGVLLEPSLSYKSGTFEPGGSTFSGFGLGGRAAYTFTPILFVGLDVQMTSGKFNHPGASSSSDGSGMAFGPMLGVSLPAVPLRFWGAFYLYDQVESKSNSTLTMKGTGIKLGGGYMLIPMLLSLNLEYEMHTLTRYSSSYSSVEQDLNPSRQMNLIVLSVSVPLSI